MHLGQSQQQHWWYQLILDGGDDDKTLRFVFRAIMKWKTNWCHSITASRFAFLSLIVALNVMADCECSFMSLANGSAVSNSMQSEL